MASAKLRAPSRKPVVVAPTWPNEGVKAAYYRALDALLQAAHNDIGMRLGLVYAEDKPTLIAGSDGALNFALGYEDLAAPDRARRRLEQLRVSCIRLAADAGVSKVDKTLTVWARRWQRKFDKLSLDMASKFADKSFGVTQTQMRAALKQAGFTVEFKPTRASLQAYKAVVAENVGLIKSIPAQYLKDVQSSVWASVRVGGDMGALSLKIQKNYEVGSRRAALIARDQNAKATAVIENTRRQQLGITQAIWQHSSAGREPRPSHLAMNGKTFDLKKGMWDPDEGERIWPGQLINCRCTSRAIISGFED